MFIKLKLYLNISDRKYKISFETIYKYPNYIELKPENLLTFDSDNLTLFLKENNGIFGLTENNKNYSRKLIYLAANTDTVKTQHFMNLEN